MGHGHPVSGSAGSRIDVIAYLTPLSIHLLLFCSRVESTFTRALLRAEEDGGEIAMRVNGSTGRGQRAKNGHKLASGAMHATHTLARTNGSNGMARATGQVDEAQLLLALTAFKQGNFGVRLPVEWTGIAGKISDTFNDVI